jgi:putative membrane protein
MTIVMMVLHRHLKARERYPLPPRIIVARLLGGRWGTAATLKRVDSTELTALTLGSHFAYGGACGGVFAAVERFVPLPRPLKGVIFGLLVWTGSYLAWLPAFGLMSPATEHPPRRTAVMLVAHIVWGFATGLILTLAAPLRATGEGAPDG